MSDEPLAKSWNATWFDFTFDQTVTVTRSFYPDLSWTKFFSEVGGSLGLWLGLGVLQMFLNVFESLKRFQEFVKKRKQAIWNGQLKES